MVRQPPYQSDPVIPWVEIVRQSGCSTWTMDQLAKRGELKIIRLSPRRKGVRQSEWERYLKANEAVT